MSWDFPPDTKPTNEAGFPMRPSDDEIDEANALLDEREAWATDHAPLWVQNDIFDITAKRVKP